MKDVLAEATASQSPGVVGAEGKGIGDRHSDAGIDSRARLTPGLNFRSESTCYICKREHQPKHHLFVVCDSCITRLGA